VPLTRGKFGVTLALLTMLSVGGCAVRSGEQPVLPAEPPTADADRSGTDVVERLLRMGRGSLAAGDELAAARLFERALTLAPDNVEAAVRYGDALLALDRAADAAEVYRHALSLDRTDLGAGRGYARAMLALNRPEVAAEHLRELIDRRGEDPELLNLLGVSLSLAARHEEAIAVYRRGLARAPDHLGLKNNLALALAFADRFDEAVAVLEPVANSVTSDRRSRQNLALVYGLKGDLEAARRISRIDLDDEAVANNLAYFEMLRGIGDRRQAVANLAPKAKSPPAEPKPAPQEEPVRVGVVATTDADLAMGRLPLGDWVLRLGLFPDRAAAERRWRELRRRHPEALRGLVRLSASEEGPQPLLVGPLASRAAAERICTLLRGGGEACDPLRM